MGCHCARCSEHEMHNCNEEDCAALGGHDWSGSWRCEDHGCWCSRCSEHELHGCDQEKCAAMGGDDWSTTWRCEDMMGCHCARCSMHDVWGCEEAACSAFAEQDPAVRWHCDDPASGGGDGAPRRTRRKLAQKFIPEIHRLLQERASIEKKRAVGKDRNLSETFGDSSRRLKGGGGPSPTPVPTRAPTPDPTPVPTTAVPMVNCWSRTR